MTSTADLVPVRRALISVSDKGGAVMFARFLAERGVEILSTGGSARVIEEAGLPVRQVSDHTGFPEILDGRLKTLHPRIHGGLLARRDSPEHCDAMTDYGIAPIDLLAVNLYPFEETVGRGAAYDACIENIDIGGPAMIRAAAKNHAFVTVLTDPRDYAAVMEDMAANGGAVSTALRRRLAATAFARTAAYDAAIAAWFRGSVAQPLDEALTLSGREGRRLRYGENPHQQAVLYRTGDARPGAATARQVQGKEMGYNNIADADAAYELAAELDAACGRPAVAIVKHANPCGAAVAGTPAQAYARALAADPVSAFGGIVAVTRTLDAATASAVAELFCEVVIAPDASAEALEILAPKRNLRVLLAGGLPDPAAPGTLLRSVAGGLLAQDRDGGRIGPAELRVVTRRAPTDHEAADLLFAWTVCKHVRSNAIVYARDGATLGIGAGQMSRVDSARIGAGKAAARAAPAPGGSMGAVVASDAFFPFADGLRVAIEAGATAAIQPGGSVRDAEVIAAADEAGIAMVFTGMRHFRH